MIKFWPTRKMPLQRMIDFLNVRYERRVIRTAGGNATWRLIFNTHRSALIWIHDPDIPLEP